MRNRRYAGLLALLICTFTTAFADVRLPSVIGSHMVLQQKSLVKFWGWCDPSEKILVKAEWDTATYQVTGGSDAKWMMQLQTPPAGGPYKIIIKGYNTLTLEDVMIGEVWDCSGQSNMEMSYSWGVKEYTRDVETAVNTNIRFFHIPRLTAQFPQDDTKGKWVVCNPEDLKRFSLAGFFFGRQLQQTLNVPVGLINASWGGTPAEAWSPKDTIENQPVLKAAAESLQPNNGWPVNAGATFNAMIYPITNYTIAGVIWYQGEANVSNASTYQLLFTTMIKAWRQAWHKELPFYFVQIAPFSGYGRTISSALLREAQTKSLSLPNTGMIVISDLVADTNDIHPKNKKDVGLRLAESVLAEVYGKKETPHKSPLFKAFKTENGKMRIYFDNADKGLITTKNAPSGFYIAGENKKFIPASSKIEGNTIVVWNKDIPAPVATRFDFTSAAIPHLFNKEGLPVNAFRTDDWNDVNTLEQ